MAHSANIPWSDDELAGSVEAYVFELRLERARVQYKKQTARDVLLSGPLNARNEASFRYRMRNISAVVAELGGPILSTYSPAEQVGRNVRSRLRAMLLAHPGFLQILEDGRAPSVPSARRKSDARAEALTRLEVLRLHLDDLEREVLGVGHNLPPETLSPGGPDRADFQTARDDIKALEQEVVRAAPDLAAAHEHSQRLLDFGFKLVLWLGERATKFADTALAILAPVVVAKATGLIPVMVQALEALGRALR